MSIDFGIESIRFSDSTLIRTPTRGVTVIVGPNNSGKTVALQEIISTLRGGRSDSPGKVVKEVNARPSGTEEDFRNWLEQNSYPTQRNVHERMVRRFSAQGHFETLVQAWTLIGQGSLGGLIDFLAYLADVDSRAQLVGMGAPDDLYGDSGPGNPVHLMYLDGSVEQRFSDICQENFGVAVTLQRLGPSLRLRLGSIDMQPPPINRPTPEYAKAEANLPLLAEQGHGMRSFLGLVLMLMTESHQVILVDEPEAFLHPPQRRSLGRIIANLAKVNESQVFVSTHDTDVLWGLLDGDAEVTVVRLTRHGDVNHARQIPSSEVKTLWTDSLLRYSRVFDGLFYRRVVVCESDSDCRFYGAVADFLTDGTSQPDCLFVPAGSKDRIHVALTALRSVGVDAVAAVDFDALRDSQTLQKLAAAGGGDWNVMRTYWERCSKAISDKRMPKPISSIRQVLDDLLTPDTGVLDREMSKKAIQVLGFKDGWEEAKKAGVSAVPNGDATTNCRSLMSELESIGVFVLPQGELESLVRDVGGHGPAWAAEVLTRGLHEQSEDAHKFVRRVVGIES